MKPETDLIDQACATWRLAKDNLNRVDTPARAAAEQEAWERYTALCDEFGKCSEPGCAAESVERAYCAAHDSGAS